MSDKRPKISVEIVTSTNLNGKVSTIQDIVMIHNNVNHKPRNGSDRNSDWFWKIMNIDGSAEGHRSENVQSPGEKNFLTKGNFNISTEAGRVQYLDPLSDDRDDSNGVEKALDCIRLRWCQTPGVEHNFLPGRMYSLVPDS